MKANELPDRYYRAWEFEGARGCHPQFTKEKHTYDINLTLVWSRAVAPFTPDMGATFWGQVYHARSVDELPPLPKCYRFKVTYET